MTRMNSAERFYAILFAVLAWLLVMLVIFFHILKHEARAADLEIIAPIGSSRPMTITRGFGTYSDHYYHRRWKKLCKGAGRYEAMSEAYELGKPDPCQGMRLE